MWFHLLCAIMWWFGLIRSRAFALFDQLSLTNHGARITLFYMKFTDAITRMPRAFDPERGAERAVLFDGQLADVVAGAAGCSPYLSGLISKHHEWLQDAFAEPEAALRAELAAVAGYASDVPPSELSVSLRRSKGRIALLTALADLAGVWPLESVTTALTHLADAALQTALDAEFAARFKRGHLPWLTEDDLATNGGLVVLAMGKMGAFELNYSSDIDLICLFDDSRYARDDVADVRHAFVQIIRAVTKTISAQTRDGYVFRTDLRLRPDAAVTPVCMSMSAAELYYEAEGRTWERAAHIKARVCAGDHKAGEAYLERLRPFVWRKHLDFAAIQDAHDMRLKIWAHKGLAGAISLPEHNVKLGRGGIREIEFFIQTQQLIAGGRDPDLRVRGTCEGLDAISSKGWISNELAGDLKVKYRALRDVEHRLQMIADAQTHVLPRDEEGFSRLAAMMGEDVAPLKQRLQDLFESVHSRTEAFFAPEAPAEDGSIASLNMTEHESDTPTVPNDFGQETIARWPSYPAMRSARATEIFNRLRPSIVAKLAQAARPEEALAHFDGFLRGLPAGVQVFSLFEANAPLVDLLLEICATSPALAAYLGRNSNVLDAVIAGDFFAPFPSDAQLSGKISDALAACGDYEAVLDTARRIKKEWHFRIGVHNLRGVIDAQTAGAQYASLAKALVGALWPRVTAEFASKHGAPMGRGAVPIAMGSLAAGQLNAGSDLDLILIYDADAEAMSDGPRPLQTRTYFARLTQALITALTAQLPEGRFYEVDMRLRPSGRQGPVASGWASYASYQKEEAWTWEHLALTRAQALGDGALAQDWNALRDDILRDTQKDVLGDTSDMRARLAGAKPASDPWDVKNGAGGVQDIELFAQASALKAGLDEVPRDTSAQLATTVANGWLNDADARAITAAYKTLWAVKAMQAELSLGPFDAAKVGTGAVGVLNGILGAGSEDEALAKVAEARQTARACIEQIMPLGGAKDGAGGDD